MNLSPIGHVGNRPPSLSLLLAEARSFAQLARNRSIAHPCATGRDGGGAPVLVLPGFLASDGSTRALRRTLTAANYHAFGWGAGRNFGVRADMLDRLDRRLDEISRIAPGKVSLIGWSLGGLYAREYAKFAPDRIDRVITLGTPFSGDMRANHAWMLYELIARHPVDRPPLRCVLTEKPPVPTFALWSSHDGVIAPASACGQAGERDHAIEVSCRHLGFTSDARALEAVFRALEHREEREEPELLQACAA
ncbi:esterase/lipase family protein [Sphingomonas sanxanigenens]|uniref:esterase/lipase family protein n=1 Tax=Sphingomonas sanxanigenens TaxID=397260 RepID=UPI0004B52267|nr:alpha/beta hydrolase [Sphingomonas sanxanigenens]